jgi:putative ABC transport system permease protein
LILLLDPRFKNWIFRFGSLSFRRKKFLSLSIVAVLGLSACLMNLLPQIKHNLYRDFAAPNQRVLPNLFVFDIQDEQVDPLQKLLLAETAQISNMSAMVRGKIIAVNDKAFERSLQVDQAITREEEEDLRFRNRGVNLSYRERLADSELIIEGSNEWGEYNPEKQEVPWISVEYWYADRLGLKLGDVLEFDVQGVRLKGLVHNFRKVKWNSFQPNFFVLFQPGVLENAPKMFLASIYGLNPEKSVQIQNQISKSFGNISVIDVSKLIERILALADRMTWSVQTLSLLTLLVGIVIMYSLIQFQLLIKSWDFNLLKVLGFSPSQMRAYVLIEYLGPVALSLFAGSVMSLLLAGVLMKYVFNSSFEVDWISLLVVNFGMLLVSTILILLSTHKILDRKASFS